MELKSEETAVVGKLRELCEAIVNEPGFETIKQAVGAFSSDEQAQGVYAEAMQAQEILMQKNQMGVGHSPEDEQAFETARDAMMQNAAARGFAEAQNKIQGLQQTVMKHVTKTFEVGRLPEEDDFNSCCGGGCGCS